MESFVRFQGKPKSDVRPRPLQIFWVIEVSIMIWPPVTAEETGAEGRTLSASCWGVMGRLQGGCSDVCESEQDWVRRGFRSIWSMTQGIAADPGDERVLRLKSYWSLGIAFNLGCRVAVFQVADSSMQPWLKT